MQSTHSIRQNCEPDILVRMWLEIELCHISKSTFRWPASVHGTRGLNAGTSEQISGEHRATHECPLDQAPRILHLPVRSIEQHQTSVGVGARSRGPL